MKQEMLVETKKRASGTQDFEKQNKFDAWLDSFFDGRVIPVVFLCWRCALGFESLVCFH